MDYGTGWEAAVSDNAVVTLCIGDGFDEMAALTRGRIQDYAASMGADYIEIRQPLVGLPYPHFEKFQMYGMFERYQRLLYLDTDMVITRDCPDLFKIVPEEAFGAYFCHHHTDMHDASIIECQKHIGDIGWSRTYFNSGVMLASRAHREVFRLAGAIYLGFYEQTQLNYNVQREKLPIFDIGYRFNHFSVYESIKRLSSYIIHYAGAGHAGENLPRVDQIRSDIAVLDGRGR